MPITHAEGLEHLHLLEEFWGDLVQRQLGVNVKDRHEVGRRQLAACVNVEGSAERSDRIAGKGKSHRVRVSAKASEQRTASGGFECVQEMEGCDGASGAMSVSAASLARDHEGG